RGETRLNTLANECFHGLISISHRVEFALQGHHDLAPKTTPQLGTRVACQGNGEMENGLPMRHRRRHTHSHSRALPGTSCPSPRGRGGTEISPHRSHTPSSPRRTRCEGRSRRWAPASYR